MRNFSVRVLLLASGLTGFFFAKDIGPESLSLQTSYPAPYGSYGIVRVAEILDSQKDALLATGPGGFAAVGRQTTHVPPSGVTLDVNGGIQVNGNVIVENSLKAASVNIGTTTLSNLHPLLQGANASLSPDGKFWEHEVSLSAQ